MLALTPGAPMIGQFTFNQQRRTHRALLNDGLEWTCDDAAIEAFLNRTHRDCPPEADRWEVGRYLLFSAAAKLNGRVEPGT